MHASRFARGIVVDEPGRLRPAFVAAARRLVDPWVRLMHRPTLEGVEHLPKTGPYLLVANHSAGIGLSEVFSLASLWVREVGADRPLAGFAHPIGFRVFPLSALMREVGAIPSTYEHAAAALAKGVPLLVFPGGDHETLRPIWQADRVDFGGRVGFLRIARDAGVSIVPLGIRGGHQTAPVLARSRALATLLVVPRLAGLKRWGVSALGAAVALALATLVPVPALARVALVWVWLGSPLTFLPWVPWTLRLRIGAPISPEALFAPDAGAPEDAELARALARVQAAVQALVDR